MAWRHRQKLCANSKVRVAPVNRLTYSTQTSRAADAAQLRKRQKVRDYNPVNTWQRIGAGWSSPVARQAHNLKVVGSNPTPATNTNSPMLSKA